VLFGDREPVVNDELHILMQSEPGSKVDGGKLVNVENVLIDMQKATDTMIYLGGRRIIVLNAKIFSIRSAFSRGMTRKALISSPLGNT